MEKANKAKRDLQWAEMINKRYKEILAALSKNPRTEPVLTAALKSKEGG